MSPTEDRRTGAGRRISDFERALRNPWVLRSLGLLSTALLAASGYFWNQKEDALKDISALKGGMPVVEQQIATLQQQTAELRVELRSTAATGANERDQLDTKIDNVEQRIYDLHKDFLRLVKGNELIKGPKPLESPEAK